MRRAFALILAVILLAAFPATEAFAASSKGKSASKSKSAPKAATAQKSKPAAKPAAKQASKTAASSKSSASKSVQVAVKLPASEWSPNKFPAGNRGWCTWYTDGRFYRFFGEKLELSPRPGSNAHTWYQRAQNVTRTSEGSVGDIMVMKRPKGDRTGHVAFVEEVVPGVGWIVTHSNFDFGGHKPLGVQKIDGRKVYTDLFVPGPRPGTIKLAGGNSVYNLIGFLHRERTPDPLEELAMRYGGGIGGDGALPALLLDGEAAAIAAREESGAAARMVLETGSYAMLNEEPPATPALVSQNFCGCELPPRLAM